MKDRDLEQLFNNTDKVKSSAEARLRARNAALAAFDEEHTAPTQKQGQEQILENKSSVSQGLTEQPRLTPESTDTQRLENRSKTMETTLETTNKSVLTRWVMSGMASAAVVVLAFTMAINFYPESDVNAGKEQEFDDALYSPTPSRPTIASKKEDFDLQEVPLSITAMSEPQPAPQARLEEIIVTAQKQSASQRAKPAAERQRLVAKMASDSALPSTGYQETGRDRFETIKDNRIKLVSDEPVSTFSVDVDTAAYTFVRRQLNQGALPQKDAVRLEEMINYFDYDYALPNTKAQPFQSNIAVLDSPWHKGNKLVHIGIKGYDLPAAHQPKSNIVFLLDVSGSMNSSDKLPLVKQSMGLLLSQLNPDDTVAIAVYAGAAGTVLEPTAAKEKQKILTALQRLSAGGSTAGGQGIKLAYQLAEANFIKEGVNRIILATDGDFNVGISNREELKGFVERKRESNIFLSVLGFGQGNYNDHMMQALAQNGNGVAAYIDTLSEAQKVLVDEATSTLFPIANDVKIQVEFNPAAVKEYRLLGYETRLLNREDFNNDKVDAGDIGAGHTVTAIYEITPTGATKGAVDELRYQPEESKNKIASQELGFVKIRYKLPNEKKSKLISQVINADNAQAIAPKLKQESQFATAVAGFAQLLRGGEHTQDWGYDEAIKLAQANKGDDNYGYRSELIQLIRKAQTADAIR